MIYCGIIGGLLNGIKIKQMLPNPNKPRNKTKRLQP